MVVHRLVVMHRPVVREVRRTALVVFLEATRGSAAFSAAMAMVESAAMAALDLVATLAQDLVAFSAATVALALKAVRMLALVPVAVL